MPRKKLTDTVLFMSGGRVGLGNAILKDSNKILSDSYLYGTTTAGARKVTELVRQEISSETGEKPKNVMGFVPLDFTDPACKDKIDKDSIDPCAATWKLDILINNAGYYQRPPSCLDCDPERQAGLAQAMLTTNFDGPTHLTEALLPYMAPRGIILNMTSHLSDLKSPYLLDVYDRPGMTLEELLDENKEYVKSILDGTYRDKGFPVCGFSFSKHATNIYTQILQRRLDENCPEKGIMVTALCPGTKHSKMPELEEDKTIQMHEAIARIRFIFGLSEEKVMEGLALKDLRGQALSHDMTFIKEKMWKPDNPNRECN